MQDLLYTGEREETREMHGGFFLRAGSIKGEVIARDDVCAKGNVMYVEAQCAMPISAHEESCTHGLAILILSNLARDFKLKALMAGHRRGRRVHERILYLLGEEKRRDDGVMAVKAAIRPGGVRAIEGDQKFGG